MNIGSMSGVGPQPPLLLLPSQTSQVILTISYCFYCKFLIISLPTIFSVPISHQKGELTALLAVLFWPGEWGALSWSCLPYVYHQDKSLIKMLTLSVLMNLMTVSNILDMTGSYWHTELKNKYTSPLELGNTLLPQCLTPFCYWFQVAMQVRRGFAKHIQKDYFWSFNKEM